MIVLTKEMAIAAFAKPVGINYQKRIIYAYLNHVGKQQIRDKGSSSYSTRTY